MAKPLNQISEGGSDSSPRKMPARPGRASGCTDGRGSLPAADATAGATVPGVRHSWAAYAANNPIEDCHFAVHDPTKRTWGMLGVTGGGGGPGWRGVHRARWGAPLTFAAVPVAPSRRRVDWGRARRPRWATGVKVRLTRRALHQSSGVCRGSARGRGGVLQN